MARTPPRTRKQLQAGDTFALRLPDGRWGACRVLRAETDEHSGKPDALVAALAWLGAEPPPLTEPRLRLLQRITAHNSAGEPNLFWVREAKLPGTLSYLGVLPPSPAEAVLGVGRGYSDWEAFTDRVAAQWRYEQEQGLPPADSEAELRRRARQAGRAHAAERRRQALANLKDPFPPDGEDADAEDSPEYRQIVRECLAALQELGPDGDEVARLDALRQCVERFNEFAVDTHLCEVICDYFDDLVWVAGLEDYGEDLNCPWRDF
jgi:hypothetical protein